MITPCGYFNNVGQIAHLNRKSNDNREENLVFLCLEHHDVFDSRTRQSKGLTVSEVRQYRDRLYEFFEATTRSAPEASSALSDRATDSRKVSIESLSFAEKDVVDVVLRNERSRTAYVKSVTFKVKGLWRVTPNIRCAIPTSALRISETYPVYFPFPIKRPPFQFSRNTHQKLEAGELDRFAFHLNEEYGSRFVAVFRMEFVYDRECFKERSDKIIYFHYPRRTTPEQFFPTSPETRQVLEAVKSVNGIKNQGVVKLLELYQNELNEKSKKTKSSRRRKGPTDRTARRRRR